MLPDEVRKAVERDWSVAMENAGVLRSLSKLDKRFDKLAHIADQLIELCADHRKLSAHLLAREAEVERLNALMGAAAEVGLAHLSRAERAEALLRECVGLMEYHSIDQRSWGEKESLGEKITAHLSENSRG